MFLVIFSAHFHLFLELPFSAQTARAALYRYVFMVRLQVLD